MDIDDPAFFHACEIPPELQRHVVDPQKSIRILLANIKFPATSATFEPALLDLVNDNKTFAPRFSDLPVPNADVHERSPALTRLIQISTRKTDFEDSD